MDMCIQIHTCVVYRICIHVTIFIIVCAVKCDTYINTFWFGPHGPQFSSLYIHFLSNKRSAKRHVNAKNMIFVIKFVFHCFNLIWVHHLQQIHQRITALFSNTNLETLKKEKERERENHFVRSIKRPETSPIVRQRAYIE